ncbi:MAG: TetR/AcrR family transcriptional regulator [Pseudomonadota bacterium]
MVKAVQKRTLETRAKLVAAAEEIIAAEGYSAMRVEQVVQKAGVAKGTFFAHFADKDALMDRIIGARIDACLDDIDKLSTPKNVESLVSHLMPLLHLMTCERYVFDVIVRHSGAAAKEEIGAIAQTFGRQIEVVARWLEDGPFRNDVPAELLADGVQAFSVQAMALHFCAVNNEQAMPARLTTYLDAWLNPR